MKQHSNTLLDDIAAVIGFTQTLRLVAFYGRVNIYLPNYPTEGSEIAKVIGLKSLEKLVSEFGPNTWLFVPGMGSFDEDRRKANILSLLRRDVAIQEVARIIGMSHSRVYQIKTEFAISGLLSGKNAEENDPLFPGKNAVQNAPYDSADTADDIGTDTGSVDDDMSADDSDDSRSLYAQSTASAASQESSQSKPRASSSPTGRKSSALPQNSVFDTARFLPRA